MTNRTPEQEYDALASFEAAPLVRAPEQKWLMPLGIGGAILLGLLVFAQLSAGRSRGEAAAEEARPQPVAAAAPAQAAPPQAPPPAAPAPPAPDPLAAAALANAEAARARAPALVVDLSEPGAATAAGAAAPGSAAISSAVGEGLSADERFVARLGGASGAARARPLEHPGATIAQGAIIAGVLETAINSDLPGYTRALVTRDVRSFDGAQVLVPRGSRLIGQYRSNLSLGQSRAFIVWTRLIRPDGASVDLNSPAADALGRGGLAGRTDSHFLDRFGGAILLSLIGAAADAAASNSDTQVVIGVSRGGESAAAAALNQEINIPPTIRVAQGAPIRIFVARDLDFSALERQP